MPEKHAVFSQTMCQDRLKLVEAQTGRWVPDLHHSSLSLKSQVGDFKQLRRNTTNEWAVMI